MTTLFEETFGTLAADTVITTSNTTFDLVSKSTSGGSVLAITDGVRSSAGRFAANATASTASGRNTFSAVRGEFYHRMYFRISSNPSANIQILSTRLVTSTQADIRVTTGGLIQLRNLGTQVGISGNTIALNTWHRLEWHWNQTGSSQEVRLFLGSNRDGTTPSETIGPFTAGGSTVDNVVRGMVTGIASWNIDIDDDKIDDTTWVGPSSVAPPTQVGTLFEETFGTLAGGTNLTTANTTYDLVSLGTGATATAIASAIRDSGGSFAVGATSATAFARKNFAAARTEVWWRIYIRLPSLPAATQSILALRSTTTFRADVRVNSTGTVTIRDQSASPVTSTATLTANAWARFEWYWNQGGNTQELRVWTGTALHSTGAATFTLINTAGGGSSDNTVRGVADAATTFTVDVDDDKASDTSWLGPSVLDPGTTGLFIDEKFEGAAAGTNLTANGNTTFDSVLKSGTATATFDTTNNAEGTRSGKLTTLVNTETVTLKHLITVLVSTRYIRLYGYFSALPTANMSICDVRADVTVRAQLRVNAAVSGVSTITIRNGTTAVQTTTAGIRAGELFRLEWKLINGTGQQARIFTGPNVHGTVADEETPSGTFDTGTFDQVNFGILTTGDVYSLWLDANKTTSTTWIGPANVPASPAALVHTGFGYPMFITPGVPPPPPPPGSDLGPLYVPIGGKIIWGATPADMSSNAITPTKLAALETLSARRMDAVRIFKSACDSAIFTSTSNEYVMGIGDTNGPRVVFLSMKESPFTPTQAATTTIDLTIHARCQEIVASGVRTVLAIHHEPEGPTTPDMPAADFRAMQLHILPIIRSYSIPTAVIYMGFSGNMQYVIDTWPDSDTTLGPLVDWIGADPYTFRNSGGSPIALSSILTSFFSWANTANRAGKPIVLGEWGCADDPTNGITDGGAGKKTWFQQAGAWMRDNADGQRIKAGLYYNSPGTVPTTPVNSTTPSLDGWKEISSPTGYPRTIINFG